AVGHADFVFEFGAAREIAALVLGIAPRTTGIPVPGADAELGVLTIGDGSPARGKRLLDGFRRKDLFQMLRGQDIERGPQRLIGVKGDGFGRGNIHGDGLRERGAAECQEKKSRDQSSPGPFHSDWPYYFDLTLRNERAKRRYAEPRRLPSEMRKTSPEKNSRCSHPGRRDAVIDSTAKRRGRVSE